MPRKHVLCQYFSPSRSFGHHRTFHEFREAVNTIVQSDRWSPSLAYDFHRVVDECLVNASRQGSATSMDIHITEDGRRITLHCADNGRGGAIANRVGLGSQLFSETCEADGGTWQLLPTGGGAEFTMTADLTRITSSSGRVT